MTTKELIKQLKDWDYTVKIDDDFIEVYDSEECKYYFSVDTREEFLVDTYNNDFTELPVEDREILFGLIYKYTTTPVGEREEEKKYYLRHRWLCDYVDNSFRYLNKSNDAYSINDDFEIGRAKTQFTQKEIDEIKQKFDTDLKDFEIIEVEE
ncbi:hypothetical protein KQI68_07050 [Peptoniphilus sp. MSJ-1]|uniref:Uncharacterized protein n=1 Tax=Peptoniphilus ovalis TaxID=2841503 RepID=A0ABS6FHF1_9FIRM|nr:hypothetical protein [Peptoniphilus ovalis]MBU5669595.1 hypothetical protein [Peptoniphilus ovalis]